MARLEDILAPHARPRDPGRPLAWFDARNKARHRETGAPVRPAPGRPARRARTYARDGAGNPFMVFAPPGNWRRGAVMGRRTAVARAHGRRALAEAYSPTAERIASVQDSRTTHTPAARSAAFPPAEAKRLRARFASHYTPAHGSRLTMAEGELGALRRRCPDRRVPDQATLRQETTAWAARRKAPQAATRRHFTTAEARVKRATLYPLLNPSD